MCTGPTTIFKQKQQMSELCRGASDLQLPHKETTSGLNPASGTGIYQNHDAFQNASLNHNSPQQQQQSQSTVGVAMPILIVNNPQARPGLHAQPQQINQQSPYQVRPLLNQPFIPQVNPLLTPPKLSILRYCHLTSHNTHLLTALWPAA